MASAHIFPKLTASPIGQRRSLQVSCNNSPSEAESTCPFEYILPFLSEHVQKSDQMLVLGADTDFPIQLALAGYGLSKTGFMLVVDSDPEAIKRIALQARSFPALSGPLSSGQLRFQTASLSSMPDVCKQSVFDAIVDYKALDKILDGPGATENMLKCIDQLQNSLRLGNILVSLSTAEKERFCSVFEQRFGWIQELDGDPGEISAWYRGKSNIAATKSAFGELGLKMYVYTNTDNC